MKKYIAFALMLLTSLYFSIPAHSQLKPMQKEQMDSITGQAGVTMEFDHSTFYDEFDEIAIYESYDGVIPPYYNIDNLDSLKMQNVVFSNGVDNNSDLWGDWGYSINTFSPIKLDMVRYDAGGTDDDTGLDINADTRTASDFKYRAPTLQTNLNMRVERLLFCDTVLGENGVLEIGQVNAPYFHFWLAPNDQGISFKADLSLEIGHKNAFTYNGPEQGFDYRQNGGDAGPGIVYAYNTQHFLALDDVSVNLDSYMANEESGDFNVVEDGEELQVKVGFPSGTTGDIKIGKVYNSHAGKDMGPINFNNMQVHEMEVRFIP